MMNFSITPSLIIEYLYCPRFTYFEYVLRIPQYEEKEIKVMKGRDMHGIKSAQNTEYLRRRIGVSDKRVNQYLTNDLLRGEVDEVLWLNDGSLAPLDYKFARYEGKLYETYRTQLACYAWLIESNFGLPVNRGFLVYTRSKNYLLEVPISRQAIAAVQEAAGAIRLIIEKNRYPNATKYRKRCVHCTYRNICTQ
ncbi:MAG: CRISPR-associated protein Cas4 [Saprospirales bacterium]|nr:CRISPR-associated protein Cas4 [Saprospirales bacterium]